MKTLLAVLMLAAAGAANAKTWNCRNAEMEIACDGEACTAAFGPDFTPMTLTLNSDGEVAICAYSGCWDGTGSVREHAGFMTVIAADLSFTPDLQGDGARQRAAIVLDTEGNVALLRLGAFAQPMTCRATTD